MSTAFAPVPTFANTVTTPVDGELEVAASVEVPFQQLANRTEHLAIDNMLRALCGGWRESVLPGAAANGIACEQLPVTAEGGPSGVICVTGNNALYVSEDNGFAWVDWETTTADLLDVAIGRLTDAESGWVAMSVGAAGEYRSVYRDASQVGIVDFRSSAAGGISGSPNLSRVVFDEPYRGTSGAAFRFWACGAGGLYRSVGSITANTHAWTQINAGVFGDVIVLPSGRVVAWQYNGGAPRLMYSDDGATLVVGANMTAYGTTTPRLAWDARAGVLVFSDGANKLAVSGDGGETINASHTYAANAVVTIFAWRGHVVIWHLFSSAAPSTGIANLFVRRPRAWSFDIADPASFRSVPAPINLFLLNCKTGTCRFVGRHPTASNTLIIGDYLSPLD